MGLEKLIENLPREEAQQVQEPVTEQPVEPQVEPTTPVEVAASIADLTGGKFEKPEDLYSEYSKLSQKLSEPPEYSWKDEWIKGVVQRYEKGEDLTPYLKAKTTNVDSMSAEDLHRMSLKEQYPNATAKQLDALYKKNVVSRFSLDPDEYNEDEMSVGRIEMEKAAEEIRNKYKEQLQPYLQPEPVQGETQTKSAEDIIGEYNRKMEEQGQQEFARLEEIIRNDPASKSLLEKKTLEIPTLDGEKFNLELEAPEKLVDYAVHANEFYKLFESDGKVDMDKFYLVANIARDPNKFISLLVQHGKELGKAHTLQEIENPSEVVRRSPTGENLNPLQRLIKGAIEGG